MRLLVAEVVFHIKFERLGRLGVVSGFVVIDHEGVEIGFRQEAVNLRAGLFDVAVQTQSVGAVSVAAEVDGITRRFGHLFEEEYAAGAVIVVVGFSELGDLAGGQRGRHTSHSVSCLCGEL